MTVTVGTVQAEATQDGLVGATLADRYRVTRLIGKGGMGVVYEAVHLALDKRVAVKLLLDKYADDHEAVERFHREALTATKIGDDHIIDVLDVGTTADGKSFVVLEYLDGVDLGKLLAATGPMPASRAVHITQQILRGLGAAHQKGIVHRDMKPDNVFIVPHSETPDFVKILDFGISKIIAAQDAKVRLTATGTVVGTPIYMAPEQALGSAVDHRADLYSVGVMLYELLAGRPPFVAESYLALVTQHLQAVPPDLAALRPDLPPALVNAIHRALAKEPDQRYRSADELARALPSPHALRSSEAMGITYGSGALPLLTPGGQPAAAFAAPSTMRSDPHAPARRRGRRTAVGAVLAVLALGAVATAVVVATRRPAAVAQAGRLRIETTPSEVAVFIDDEPAGKTPLELADVALGKHRVRLEREGYVSMSTTTAVAAGERASIIVAMTPAEPLTAPSSAGTPGAAAGSGPAERGDAASAGAGTAVAPAPTTGGSSGAHRRPHAADRPASRSGSGTVNPYAPYDGGTQVEPRPPTPTDTAKGSGSGKEHRGKPNPYGDDDTDTDQ